MDSQQTLYLLLSSFVRQLPEFIVIIVGVIICFINLRNSPKAGKIALGGLFILLITAFLGILITPFLVYLPVWYGYTYQTVGYITFIVGITLSIIRAVGLGLVIYAIWVGRDRASKT